jgi:DNA-binding transcriptional LysR family regulator
MEITLRQIKYFMAVADTGKIVTAASLVGISPSSITEAIKELESITGVKLVTRHRKGISLTFDGFRFLNHCNNITAAVSNAKYALHNSHTEITGKLRLGITITVAGYFLASPLARFKRSFPEIEVEILEDHRLKIEKKLAQGELDVAILLVSNVTNKHLKMQKVASSRRRLWIPTNHRFTDKKDITMKDIHKEPYIQLMIDEACETHMAFWKKSGFVPNIIFQTSSIEAVRSMIAVGLGVTILSDMVYRPWSLEGDRINALTISGEVPEMEVGVCWHKKKKVDPVSEVFLEFCRMEFNSGSPGHNIEGD